MLRFFGIILFVLVVSSLVLWLGQMPGSLEIMWLGYRATLSIQAAFWLLLLWGVGLVFLIFLGVFIWETPLRLWGYLKNRKMHAGRAALERASIAFSSGRGVDAVREIKSAAARIGHKDPLVPLLESRIFEENGMEKEAFQAHETLLKSSILEGAGLYGLYRLFQKKKDRLRALDMATRALRSVPTLPWANGAVLADRALAEDWEIVTSLLESHFKLGLLDEKNYQKKRAAIEVAHGLRQEKEAPDVSLTLALKAHRLDPALVPAATLVARRYSEMGAFSKAQKILEQTWALSPHGDIAQAYANAGKTKSGTDRLERFLSLRQRAPGGEEGAVVWARFCLEAGRWEEARQALADYSSGHPRSRVCWVMMSIALHFGQMEEALMWFVRASQALPDPLWTDGVVCSRVWQPVSLPSGEIGGFCWKPPFELQNTPFEAPAWLGAVPTPILKEGMGLFKSLHSSSQDQGKALRVEGTPSGMLHQPDDPGVEGEGM